MWKQSNLVPGKHYLYGWNRMGRKGERCLLHIVGKTMNSVMVEFDDGHKAITSANALRPLPPGWCVKQPSLF